MIKNTIARLLTRLVNLFLRQLRNQRHVDLSREEIRSMTFGFGQYMEDVSVVRWANILQIKKGIYVDVGAHDPVFCSNTLQLHKKGWQGINIDMNEERIRAFENQRPSDFNIAAAISDQERETVMLSYPAGGTDRLGCAADDDKLSLANEEPIGEESVRTTTLDQLLPRCPFEIPRIDYLNVDAEGHDLSVLKSMDFSTYSPAIVTVEAATDVEVEEISRFLKPLGYRLEEKLFDTLLFVDSKLPRDRSKLYG